MSEIYINRDCPYYDWGKTAPREYGAFCSKKKCTINRAGCGECEEGKNNLKDIVICRVNGLKCSECTPCCSSRHVIADKEQQVIDVLKQFGKEVLENQSYDGGAGWYAYDIMRIFEKD
jgi:hypothetical protein